MAAARVPSAPCRPLLLGLAAILAGCAASPPGPVLTEAGNSLERLRDRLAWHFDTTGERGPRSLALRAQFAGLRASLARLPETLRLRQPFLPDADDFERLIAPPPPGWRPAPLGERLVERLRF